MIEKEQDTNKEDEIRLPMYYEQINGIMDRMCKRYEQGDGREYNLLFRQLLSRVSPDLSEERRKYFISALQRIESELLLFKNANEWDRHLLKRTYPFEIDLFDDLNRMGVFTILKTKSMNMELIK